MTALAKTEGKTFNKKWTGVVKPIRCAPFSAKRGRFPCYRRTRKVTEDARNAEETKPTAEGTARAKRIANGRLQSELAKESFIHVVSMAQKKKAERNKRQRHATLSEKLADKNYRASKETFGRRSRIRLPALFIKPRERTTFVEVFSEIHYRV